VPEGICRYRSTIPLAQLEFIISGRAGPFETPDNRQDSKPKYGGTENSKFLLSDRTIKDAVKLKEGDRSTFGQEKSARDLNKDGKEFNRHVKGY